MDELIAISEATGWFDLFEFFSLLTDEGGVAVEHEIDRSAATAAGNFLLIPKLPERVRGALIALRAWKAHADNASHVVGHETRLLGGIM